MLNILNQFSGKQYLPSNWLQQNSMEERKQKPKTKN